jgi:arginase
MAIHVLQVPYDSGHRDRRMGHGPIHLLEHGVIECLQQIDGEIQLTPVEVATPFPTEIGTAFELHRTVAHVVATTVQGKGLPLVLSGNCNSAIGTVAGLYAAHPGTPVGIIWFDGHGDCNTPETFTGDFLDAMALSTLTGRCWQALASTVPGFRSTPDEHAVLVGAHGADEGALSILSASRIAHVRTPALKTDGVANAMRSTLDVLTARGVARVYVHLDVDVLDAAYAPANQFAPVGGLLPNHMLACVEEVARRFTITAATVASYDPMYDREDRILHAALRFLTLVASTFQSRK